MGNAMETQRLQDARWFWSLIGAGRRQSHLSEVFPVLGFRV